VKRFILILAILCTMLAIGACREEGTLEKAGKSVDKAMDDAVDKVKHGDEGAMEKAGRKIDEAYEDTKDAVKGD
jgi:uncharacterized protein YjbJ (UPF0337 family)